MECLIPKIKNVTDLEWQYIVNSPFTQSLKAIHMSLCKIKNIKKKDL